MSIVSFLNVEPGKKTTGATIAQGRWCLHTTSTVPWVQIQAGSEARVISWGDIVQVDTQGTVLNASAHQGDIHLSPVLLTGVSPRPARYTVPVRWDIQLDQTLVSKWLDVRGVRRAYLAVNTDAPLPTPLFIDHSNDPPEHAPPIGLQIPPGSAAASTAGIVTEQRNIALFSQYSLGIRALDVPPGYIYPHTLLSRLRVRFLDTNLAPLLVNADPFFVLEF